MSIQLALNEFGQKIGLAGLAFDEQDSCTLQFDQVVVNMELVNDREDLYCYSRLGDLPEDQGRSLAVMKDLMSRNCFFRGTSGGVLGFEPGLDILTYTNKVAAKELDAGSLSDYLEAYVNLVESLIKDVAALLAETPEAGRAGEELAPPAGIKV